MICIHVHDTLSVMLHEFGYVAFLDPQKIVYRCPKRPKSIWFFSQGYCFLLVKMIIDKNKHKHQLGKNQIDEKENNLRLIIEK